MRKYSLEYRGVEIGQLREDMAVTKFYLEDIKLESLN